MKILITETNQVVAFGQFVHAEKGQTIVDTDELTVANIKEIATANGAKITAKKKAEIVSQLNDHMVENNTEVTEMTDIEKYEQIVVDGFANELTDGQITRQLFDAGVEFTEIGKVFKDIVTSKGLRLTPKERNEKASEFLEGYSPDVDDVESHLAKVSALQDHLDCSTTQAGASMRKWAKANDITLPKAPVKSKAKIEPGFRGNMKIVTDWILSLETIPTLEEIVKYAADNVPPTKKGNDSSKGCAITAYNAMIFAQAMYSVEEEVETDLEEAA